MEVIGDTKKVEFHEVKRGYSIEEVDEYVRILSYEYEQVLEELRISKEKNKDLEEENRDFRQQLRKAAKKSATSEEKEAIASLLIKAELMAKEIKSDAEKEVIREKEEIRKELEVLQQTKQEVIADLQKINTMIQDIVLKDYRR